MRYFRRSGVTLGVRVGYAIPFLWFAAEASRHGDTIRAKTRYYADYTVEGTTFSGVVGLKVMSVRIWGGSSFNHVSKMKSSNVESTFQGLQTKVGLGFSLLSAVSINVEHVTTDFNKVKTGSAEADIPDPNGYDSFKWTKILASVSLPFEI